MFLSRFMHIFITGIRGAYYNAAGCAARRGGHKLRSQLHRKYVGHTILRFPYNEGIAIIQAETNAWKTWRDKLDR